MSDLRRGYRICAFHRKEHGGVHVHYAIELKDKQTVRLVAITSMSQAEAIKVGYAATHEVFRWESFRRWVERWTSSSKNT